jgi:fatty acid desaturase
MPLSLWQTLRIATNGAPIVSDHKQTDEVTLNEGRALVADLFEPKPWIYWTDFLLSISVGYACAAVYLLAPPFSWQQIVCFPIAGALLYRVGCYMHEIVHFRTGQMKGFRVAWDIIAGIPMLTPSFMYIPHIDHHMSHHYGTAKDGEYLPLGAGRALHIATYLAQIAILPALVVFRFLILVPLSFTNRKWRDWVLQRASSLGINLLYVREIPDNAPRFWWAAMDIACSLRCWAIFVLVAVGFNHWSRPLMLYSIAMMTLGLNHYRALIAHRYLSNGEKMTHLEQLSDSINVSGGLLTEIAFPLGLRYHALHHFYPSVPYHNLYEAHRRLMDRLPDDSPYHAVTYKSSAAAMAEMIRTCRAVESGDAPPAAEQWYQRRREMLAKVGSQTSEDDERRVG